MLSNHTLGVIGAGNMGQALIAGAINAGVLQPRQIVASDCRSEPLQHIQQHLGVAVTADNNDALQRSDVVLVAVKPQGFGELMTATKGAWRPNHIVLSVVAGVTTQTIEAGIGLEIPVIRVMPNTPALVGQGMSAYCCGRFAQDTHASLAAALFDCVGQSIQVPEALIDPITATSGSGPAYVFYLVESMQQAAQSLGIPQDMAKTLVQQTVLGAATLLMSSDQSAQELRARVTSPGGTTAAAIGEMQDRDFQGLIQQAMTAACDRAKALGDA